MQYMVFVSYLFLLLSTSYMNGMANDLKTALVISLYKDDPLKLIFVRHLLYVFDKLISVWTGASFQ